MTSASTSMAARSSFRLPPPGGESLPRNGFSLRSCFLMSQKQFGYRLSMGVRRMVMWSGRTPTEHFINPNAECQQDFLLTVLSKHVDSSKIRQSSLGGEWGGGAEEVLKICTHIEKISNLRSQNYYYLSLYGKSLLTPAKESKHWPLRTCL